MEQQKPAKRCNIANHNHHFYLSLQPHNYLELILLSTLDDGVSHCRLTTPTLPTSCANLFQDVDGMYEFLQENGSDPQKVSVSDVGVVTLVDHIPNKSKIVKVSAEFATQKVYQQQLLAQFYLKIIKHSQNQPEVGIKKDEKQKSIRRNRQFGKLQLTVDMENNPFLKCFSKKANRVKIQQYVNKRIKLYFREVIPKEKCTYFTIRIVTTKTGNFGFGLFDQKQQRQDKSYYSMCYDFSTGDLKDSNFVKEAKQCKWRKVGAPIAQLKNAVLRIEVNPKDQRVAFFCNNEWLCETVIPNYLMKTNLVPYISVKHQGDQYLINDE